MVWVILSLSAAVLVGLVGRVYLTTPLIGTESEKVFMIMAQEMFPTILTGFLLAAILSAIMSTMITITSKCFCSKRRFL